MCVVCIYIYIYTHTHIDYIYIYEREICVCVHIIGSIIGTDLMQSGGWLSCLCKAVVSAFDART